MKFRIISGESVPLSTWAGGTSKQYFIFPESSSYQGRDFLFRMSMATSNSDEKSVYSDLKNFTRHLVMLDGMAKVTHVGHYDITMIPYETIDVFDGGWESFAEGKAADFNLMIGQGAVGQMSILSEKGMISLNDFSSEKSFVRQWCGFFCAQGSGKFKIAEDMIALAEGDLLLMEEVRSEEEVELMEIKGKLIRMDVGCF